MQIFLTICKSTKLLVFSPTPNPPPRACVATMPSMPTEVTPTKPRRLSSWRLVTTNMARNQLAQSAQLDHTNPYCLCGH